MDGFVEIDDENTFMHSTLYLNIVKHTFSCTFIILIFQHIFSSVSNILKDPIENCKQFYIYGFSSFPESAKLSVRPRTELTCHGSCLGRTLSCTGGSRPVPEPGGRSNSCTPCIHTCVVCIFNPESEFLNF